MPIDHDLLGLQRRDVHLGEIRIGRSIPSPTKANPNRRLPERLNTFRLTTPLEHAAEVAAENYGGKVAPWEGKRGYYEVITTRTRLRVFIPPRSLAVDANMELWDGGKRKRQCDGRAMRFPSPREGNTALPCMCPADPDERDRLASMQPPQACSPLTRFNVTLPALPGLNGVWSASTGSVNAAVETADVGDILAIARGQGAYLPGDLFIHWRQRADNGKPYPVLSLMISTSAEELARGDLPVGAAGLVAQIQGRHLAVAGGQTPALTAGSPAPAAAQTSPAAQAEPSGPVPGTPAWENLKAQDKAQLIADMAAQATARADVTRLWDQAEADGLADDHICVDRAEDVWEELRLNLQAKWRSLPPEAAAG